MAKSGLFFNLMLTSLLPPPTRACHSAHHVATSLISVTFLFLLNTVVMELESKYGPLQV